MSAVLAAAAQTAHQLIARHDHSGLTEAEEAEGLIDPWNNATKYANAAIIMLCIGVATFGVLNLLAAFRRTSSGARIARNKTSRRAVAAARYVSTSQPKALGAFVRFPTTGVIVLIAMVWLFILIWSFAQQPYYRSRWNVGSPPLAIRTGMFALGLFPFIMMFGAKWNIVTFITGYSYEKLQVFHQWLSHLFLILSLLHTFPFVMAGREIRPNTDGLNPNGYSQIYYSWFVAHKVYYWSGTAALICLAWLCWGSFAPLRNRFYEVFKLLHIISAILFTAFFYIHCNALLFSWHYLWATAAIYFTSVVMRFGLIFVRNGISVPRATVEHLSDNSLRVTIRCPEGHRWSAGQHYFLNFVKAAPLESHPYTIANAPYLHPNAQAPARTMIVLLRPSPRSLLGPRLMALAESGCSTPVLLDGPYGGLSKNADLSVHQTVLLLAGGSGATFATALLEDLCERKRRGYAGFETTKIEIHWAAKSEDAKCCFEEQIDEILSYTPKGMVELNLYITEGAINNLDKLEKSDSSSVSPGSSSEALSKPPPVWIMHSGRPKLPSLLQSKLAGVDAGSSVGIASCGPPDFASDVRRAVAARQKLIMLGKTGSVGAEEVELHSEDFEW